jgi:hypothetical protein
MKVNAKDRVFAILYVSGYIFNLLYAFVLIDYLNFDIDCGWVVPQLRKFEVHFSREQFCSANSILVSSYIWLLASGLISIASFLMCVKYLPIQTVSVGLPVAKCDDALRARFGKRNAYALPAFTLGLLCLHFFVGFVRKRSGLRGSPELLDNIVAFAQFQSLLLHVIVGILLWATVWTYFFSHTIQQSEK